MKATRGKGGKLMIVTFFKCACPRCGAAEGPYRMGQSLWFYCVEHKVKWLAAYEQPATDRDLNEERRNYEAIGLGEFEYLGPDAEGYYAKRPPKVDDLKIEITTDAPVYHVPGGYRRDGNGEIIPLTDFDEAKAEAAVLAWFDMLAARHPSKPYVIVGPQIIMHMDPSTQTCSEEPTPEGAWQPSALSDWGLSSQRPRLSHELGRADRVVVFDQPAGARRVAFGAIRMTAQPTRKWRKVMSIEVIMPTYDEMMPHWVARQHDESTAWYKARSPIEGDWYVLDLDRGPTDQDYFAIVAGNFPCQDLAQAFIDGAKHNHSRAYRQGYECALKDYGRGVPEPFR
jgi:hypothetical protein